MISPLISICIPVYNGEKYLAECIDSCIGQTFRDFEIIICDDGSIDSSWAILEKYQKKTQSLRLYRNEKNLGLVGNWNRCAELATGRWIKFLFQDDIMESNCLQKLNEKFKEETQLVVCRRNFMLDKNASASVKNYYDYQVKTFDNLGYSGTETFSPQLISHLAASHIGLNFIGEPSLVIFKKAVLNKTGHFDEQLKQICDLEFLLRVSSNYGLTYIPEQLCSFRIHAGSTTEKNSSSEDYHQLYLESLLYSAKLIAHPQFKRFRDSLTKVELYKLKLYTRYKSFLAFKGIKSEQDQILYSAAENKYPGTFFRKNDQWLLRFISLIRK